ncbi:uncharacterized protein BDZ83DRAFT_657466 [Colletotrichum acutatum]|uniref:Uncharacterized protein n=1 Tax=Glomerella acutata TaxID=27357 RepID=A0AAD8X8V1_GLOAC|nr:uncharacterized protein BDZ83DRAFT_657466 [Colletotrichum acutatum]KAK1708675.1 hypothetical protein BDZ83DRAFT_657466 [Colletotrichum acutatum]
MAAIEVEGVLIDRGVKLRDRERESNKESKISTLALTSPDARSPHAIRRHHTDIFTRARRLPCGARRLFLVSSRVLRTDTHVSVAFETSSPSSELTNNVPTYLGHGTMRHQYNVFHRRLDTIARLGETSRACHWSTVYHGDWLPCGNAIRSRPLFEPNAPTPLFSWPIPRLTLVGSGNPGFGKPCFGTWSHLPYQRFNASTGG